MLRTWCVAGGVTTRSRLVLVQQALQEEHEAAAARHRKSSLQLRGVEAGSSAQTSETVALLRVEVEALKVLQTPRRRVWLTQRPRPCLTRVTES
jgi:hypothetical protein